MENSPAYLTNSEHVFVCKFTLSTPQLKHKMADISFMFEFSSSEYWDWLSKFKKKSERFVECEALPIYVLGVG